MDVLSVWNNSTVSKDHHIYQRKIPQDYQTIYKKRKYVFYGRNLVEKICIVYSIYKYCKIQLRPSRKITGRRMDEEKEYLVQRPGSIQGEGNL